MKVDAGFDAGALHRLVSGGPTVSLYFGLAAPPEEEEAEAEGTERRLRVLLDELARQGIRQAVGETLAERVWRSLPGTGTLAVFVPEKGEPTVIEMPGASLPDLVRCGPLPYIRPLLAWHRSRPPYVLAAVGPGSAEIEVHRGGTADVIVRTVDRSSGGDAVDVAKAVTDELIGWQVPLLLLAGDVHSVQQVDRHLSGGVRTHVGVRYVYTARPGDEPGRPSATLIGQQLDAWLREQDQRLLCRIDAGRNAGGWAVEGAKATLDALARGRVRELVVVDAPDGRTAWFGPAADHVSLDREGLAARGTAVAVQSAPLIDVALRTAVLTGATTHILPPRTPNAPAEGIGGLCWFGGA